MENKRTILLSLLNFNNALAHIDLFHAFCLPNPKPKRPEQRGQEAPFLRGQKLSLYDAFAVSCCTAVRRAARTAASMESPLVGC